MERLFFVIIGTFYFLLALLLFGLNGLVFLTLIIHKEFKTKTYRIIANLCVACMMQLFVFAIGGIMTICRSVFNHYLDRVLGVIIQSSWLLYVGITLTLAIDRLLIFVCSKNYSVITTTFLTLSWLLWLLNAIGMCFPGHGATYSRDKVLWTYADNKGAAVFIAIEPYCEIGIFCAVFVIYLIAFGYLVKVKLSSTHDIGSIKTELRIFVVAVISFTYEASYIAYSYWAPGNPSRHVPSEVVLNFVWMLECGMFASLTVIMSGSLRRGMKKMVCRKNTISSVHAIHTQ
ncbi:hypothetical protein QR680_003709 [Steinernema hermaphroditum]|uniref:Uncharacterized protein n=1 Tax=Steinernema hermaphroditum TaxID=289476 RepID=A0AA39HLA6_9BILA|nr:hypothetical protein QR680_003709 [Steinernema hermaphroditum]